MMYHRQPLHQCSYNRKKKNQLQSKSCLSPAYSLIHHFSVKPLLQSTLMDNSSSTNTNPNVVNPPDRLTTTTIHNSSRTNYANLR
jgi:hypothetical protein